MYPAVEIGLRLHDVLAAQMPLKAAPGAASRRAVNGTGRGTNLLLARSSDAVLPVVRCATA